MRGLQFFLVLLSGLCFGLAFLSGAKAQIVIDPFGMVEPHHRGWEGDRYRERHHRYREEWWRRGHMVHRHHPRAWGEDEE